MASTLKESAKKKKKGQDLISSASKTVPTVNGKARHAGLSKQKVEERRKRDETDDDTDEESDQDSEDSESGDVDEAGMNRLMELLGDDGLDDIAKLQLEMMENDDDDDDDGEGEGSEDDEDDEEDDSVQEEDIQENRRTGNRSRGCFFD
ncbi:hypothetical protein FRC18_011314 [Serendipita sp. 400]|nr:hypothetical protein FRC18_011314 [Serendipita sp. 400]